MCLAVFALPFALSACGSDDPTRKADADSTKGQKSQANLPAAGSQSKASFVLETGMRSLGGRVDLGINEQFKSSDRGYVSVSHLGTEQSLSIDGDSFVFESDFSSLSGSPVGPGTLTVECS